MIIINLFELYAVIGLKDDGFKSGINEAQGSMSKFNTGVGGLIEKVAGIKVVSMAIDAVKNSINGAVERYDTLNKFPRVLELMGFSASDASKATDKLRDGIVGLPTSLDGIIKNAQRITTLTGNLELATDTTLALNNAFLASGATTEDASRGLTQYVQQLSKGKVDIISWRTLQETMGFALRQVSEEMLGAGSSSNDLYEALKSGSITFDQLNSKIIELSTRTGGFADMAKEASGGIGTSWTNMQLAITRGTTAIIEAIDKGLVGFGGIQGVLASVGKGFEEFLKNIAGAAVSVLSFASGPIHVLTNVLGVVVKNFDVLVPAVLAATAAFAVVKGIETWHKAVTVATSAINAAKTATAAMTIVTGANNAIETVRAALLSKSAAAEVLRTAAKTAGLAVDEKGNLVTAAGVLATEAEAAATIASTGAISLKNVVVGVLTGQISLATAAQWAWNAAMSANPIGVVIVAVAALVAGLNWLHKALSQESEAAKKVADANKTLIESLESSAKAREDNMNKIEYEIGASKKLADQILELSAIENKSVAEKQELAAKVDLLNKSMDGLNVQYDIEKDLLSQTTDEIYGQIDARAELIRTQAAQERAVAIAREQLEIEQKLKDTTAELIRLRNLGFMEAVKEYGILGGDKLKNDIKERKEEIDKLSKTYSSNEVAFTSLVETITEGSNKQIDSLDGVIDKTDDYNKSIKSMADVTIDIFKKIDTEASKSLEEVMDNMISDASAWNEYWQLLGNLTKKGLDEGVLQEFAKMGPAANKAMREMDESGAYAIKEANRNWTKLMKAAGGENAQAYNNALSQNMQTADVENATLQQISSTGKKGEQLARSEGNTIGKSLGRAMAIGVQETSSEFSQSIAKMIQAGIQAGKNEMKMKSPPRVFVDMGAAVPPAFALGVSRTADEVPNAMEKLFGNLGGEVDYSAVFGSQMPQTSDFSRFANQAYAAATQAAPASTAAQPSGGNTYILQVNMDEVDEVYKLTQVFDNFTHSRTVYEGV